MNSTSLACLIDFELKMKWSFCPCHLAQLYIVLTACFSKKVPNLTSLSKRALISDRSILSLRVVDAQVFQGRSPLEESKNLGLVLTYVIDTSTSHFLASPLNDSRKTWNVCPDVLMGLTPINSDWATFKQQNLDHQQAEGFKEWLKQFHTQGEITNESNLFYRPQLQLFQQFWIQNFDKAKMNSRDSDIIDQINAMKAQLAKLENEQVQLGHFLSKTFTQNTHLEATFTNWLKSNLRQYDMFLGKENFFYLAKLLQYFSTWVKNEKPQFRNAFWASRLVNNESINTEELTTQLLTLARSVLKSISR
ncbi:hypothetical protein O181_084235 [Austropuccinia psidii MF-1]|uniref:Uncharacterized protein n=1 Tax=Austropuccinia psidii MF-1 TaxID=1389203 RepID=A0A9Q3FV84_9BASI|nr:hypothetical protein [Austropuccinia psidii MF-1]